MALTPGQRAARTKRRKEIGQTSGTASVYVCHSQGFSGNLRPAYDTAPKARAELTQKQVNRLCSLIARFMAECERKNRAAMEGD